MDARSILKDFEYTRAKELNEYLRVQNETIREKIIELILADICIHCYDVNTGICHCMNDE